MSPPISRRSRACHSGCAWPGRRHSWKCAAKCTCRRAPSTPLIGNGRHPASLCLRTRATPPPDLFIYGIGAADGIDARTHDGTLVWLKSARFPINPHTALCRTMDEVTTYVRKWTARRTDLQYETDGVVIKINSLVQQAELGATSQAPR